jgi:hypothetical protein
MPLPTTRFIRRPVSLTLFVCLCALAAHFSVRATAPLQAGDIQMAHVGEHEALSAGQKKTIHKESGPFIDGAKNPELIPDDVAFSHFFRTSLARNASENALRRQASYINHVLRSTSTVENGAHSTSQARPKEIDAVLRFIAGYQERLKALDARRGSVAEEGALVADIVAEMERELGPDLSQRVKRYVQEHFKKRVKIIY